MASHAAPKNPRYLGYVGGIAVATGIGAALAVAGQGTAHADEKDSGAKTGAVDAGPAKTEAKSGATTGTKTKKPFSKIAAQAQKTVDQAAKSVTSAAHDALAPKSPRARPAKPTDKQFEATQVKLLKEAFTPKAATVTPSAPATPTIKSTVSPSAAKTAESSVATNTAAAAAIPGLPDPFRADDPDPDDMPSAILELRNSFVGGFDPTLQPYAREGFEAAYRFSQTVPYLNVAVPITKILPAVGQALTGDDSAKAASQVIVNQVLLTTQPVSLLYYGYDELADLANLESEGTALKQQFYVTAWNTLDPLDLLHVAGDSGLTTE
jgi:hypothetical protein